MTGLRRRLFEADTDPQDIAVPLHLLDLYAIACRCSLSHRDQEHKRMLKIDRRRRGRRYLIGM
jgi:hypothetical protein